MLERGISYPGLEAVARNRDQSLEFPYLGMQELDALRVLLAEHPGLEQGKCVLIHNHPQTDLPRETNQLFYNSSPIQLQKTFWELFGTDRNSGKINLLSFFLQRTQRTRRTRLVPPMRMRRQGRPEEGGGEKTQALGKEG